MWPVSVITSVRFSGFPRVIINRLPITRKVSIVFPHVECAADGDMVLVTALACVIRGNNVIRRSFNRLRATHSMQFCQEYSILNEQEILIWICTWIWQEFYKMSESKCNYYYRHYYFMFVVHLRMFNLLSGIRLPNANSHVKVADDIWMHDGRSELRTTGNSATFLPLSMRFNVFICLNYGWGHKVLENGLRRGN